MPDRFRHLVRLVDWLHFAWVVGDAKSIVVTTLCVCLWLSLIACSHYTLLHGPGCNFGEWWGCSLVVHYWAYLQSVLGFRCYDNIAPCVLAISAHDTVAANAKCQRVTRSAPGWSERWHAVAASIAPAIMTDSIKRRLRTTPMHCYTHEYLKHAVIVRWQMKR